MDVLEEVTKLLEAKEESENSMTRRVGHIKWLWICVAFMMTTGMTSLITATLWYANVNRWGRAVEQIYESYFGHPLP